jgi:hypothetical protein
VLPIQSASAQEATLVERVIDGQVYDLQPAALQAAKANGAPMVIRNDLNPNRGLSVSANDLPPTGQCRLWYPDRATTVQPSVSACDVVVPRGAVLLIG